MAFLETHDFFGGSSRMGQIFPRSRDHQDIDCNAKSCRYNRDGKCTTPSKAVINDDGKCQGFTVTGKSKSVALPVKSKKTKICSKSNKPKKL